jgi:hypothetical protein
LHPKCSCEVVIWPVNRDRSLREQISLSKTLRFMCGRGLVEMMEEDEACLLVGGTAGPCTGPGGRPVARSRPRDNHQTDIWYALPHAVRRTCHSAAVQPKAGATGSEDLFVGPGSFCLFAGCCPPLTEQVACALHRSDPFGIIGGNINQEMRVSDCGWSLSCHGTAQKMGDDLGALNPILEGS